MTLFGMGVGHVVFGARFQPQKVFLETPLAVETLKVDHNTLVFKTQNGSLVFENKGHGQLFIRDALGFPVLFQIDSGQIKLIDPRFENTKIFLYKTQDQLQLAIAFGDLILKAWITSDAFSVVGTDLSIHNQKTLFSDGFASGRGYIWNRTLPLLKDCWLLGCDTGSFSTRFPQHDNVGKFNTFGHTAVFIDKPHSLWVGALYNYGLTSIIFLIVLVGICLRQLIVSYFKRAESSSKLLTPYFSLSCLAFFLTSFFIDPFPSNMALMGVMMSFLFRVAA